MFQVYNCLTVEHDWRLVLLAIGVCLLASGVAVSLFHRAQAAVGPARLNWIALDAAAAGCGIWATHFIAMLAYAPAIHASYGLIITAISLLIAVLLTGAGFGLALFGRSHWTPVAGGAVVGMGISAMHYTGMLALQLPAYIIWSPAFVVASIVLGVLFGALAVFFAARPADWINVSVASVLLAFAIVGTHFTGMAAIANLPDPSIYPVTGELVPAIFSIVVAGATTIVLSTCLVAAFSDRRWKGTLRSQKVLLDTALENMSQGLCMFDANGRVTLSNAKYSRMTGIPPGPINGRSLLDILRERKANGSFTGDANAQFANIMETTRAGKTNNRNVEIGDRTVRIIEVPMEGGGWIATFEDITEWVISQAKISHMAHHDALTDLANRAQLIEKLGVALDSLTARADGIAIYFVDLDHFKSVNDTLGHDGGDFLLKTVANRLLSATRAGDIVARLGGDEFVVVQSNVRDPKKAEEFAHRLVASVCAPVALNGKTISPTISVGIAIAPENGRTPERLLKCADMAMYNAKDAGRNCVWLYNVNMDAKLLKRTMLERLLRDTIAHKRFVLHYQPIFELTGRRLVGFEALIRLPAEDGTLIAPNEFIPLAEELGLVDVIGAWALHEACGTAATWPSELTIAVNLSTVQFLTENICDLVADALKRSGLAPHRLELEITESLLLGDTDATTAQLIRLKTMGVAIVMDDFGIGYSSLAYLLKFPFDKLKIDRSFIQELGGAEQQAQTVVKAMIALGRELNMRVTVEGVETAEQVAFLKSVEGDQAQGFYFGKPVPAAEIGASLLKEIVSRERRAALAVSKFKVLLVK